MLNSCDDLIRLTTMQRSTLNGTQTAIAGAPVEEQDWTLGSPRSHRISCSHERCSSPQM